MAKDTKGKAKRASTRNRVGDLKENPFEVRINKRRYDILGRKIKHEKGKPGVSRSRGLKKRERTLLVEYKQRNKANTFIDKRFGEYDENLSLEEKMLKRFATEKQRHHEKTGLFNLENEELTHFGQSLGDLKHFDDHVVSDDDDEKNDTVYKDDHHFGGFLKRKSAGTEKAGNEPRSKKEIMEEVVANAKIKKHERQVAKEEAETMRQKLDEGLDSIRSLLSFRADGNKQREKADDYDITVREMAFEVKVQASDKLKTEEQLAKIEEEKLKKLESERIRRMKGLPREEKKPTHVSADDLVDCYAVSTDNRSLLSYKDGKMLMPSDDNDENWGEELTEKQDCSTDHEEGDNDENEDHSKDDSDLELTDSESSETEVEILQSQQIGKKHHQHASRQSSEDKTTEISSTDLDNLPYMFEAPRSFEEFDKLVRGRSTSDMVKVVERIQKCNHPKLNPGNKSKMEVLFDILIKYIDNLLSLTQPDLGAVNTLVCHLFNLAQLSPVHASKSMQTKLKEIQKRFCERNRKDKLPELQTVIHLRIISVVFPTSDFRHAVCTPALLFMGQILSQITIRSVRAVFIGLFVCSLVHEFVRISKRFVPEVINYLVGILYLSSEKIEPLVKVFPPFKPDSKYKDLVKITSNDELSSSEKPKPVSLGNIFTNKIEDNNSSRNTALYTSLVVLKKFVTLYSDLASFPELFQPVVNHMKRIKISNYSSEVQSLHFDILETITGHVTKRQPLALHTRRPVPIQMFEPKFEEHYEVKRKHSSGNKHINERQKLRYKHKKEFKGALREIRKDSQFLARQQLKEQLQRDAERARKTKEIQIMLSNQQAEANEFNRKKRKTRK